MSNGTKSIESILDAIKPNRFMVGVWIWCCLVMFFDGYDLTVIAFMAPEMVKEFGIERSSLGLVFSSSLIGMAVGAPLAGLFGDKYGRKFTTIVCCFLFGCGTLAILLASTAVQLAACRFIVGLGMGGAVPTVIAMTAEFTPKRLRSRVMALAGTAVPFGAIIPGVLTATLVAPYGWRVLPLVGGIFPVLLGLVLIWRLPESIKYLALRAERKEQLASVLRKLDPTVQSLPVSLEVTEKKAGSASPARLFAGGMLVITPLLWLMFFANGMVNYLVNNWMPLVLQGAGLTIQQAGLTSAMWAVGGMIGGLTIAALLSWAGVALLAALFVLAIPFLLLMATDLSVVALTACVLIAGISVGAIQIGANTIAGLMYSTSVRVTGVGWALAVGRIGAILGPLVGGAVVALQLPPQQMFAFSAIPMAVGAVAAIVFGLLAYRHFGGLEVQESAQENESGSTVTPVKTAEQST